MGKAKSGWHLTRHSIRLMRNGGWRERHCGLCSTWYPLAVTTHYGNVLFINQSIGNHIYKHHDDDLGSFYSKSLRCQHNWCNYYTTLTCHATRAQKQWNPSSVLFSKPTSGWAYAIQMARTLWLTASSRMVSGLRRSNVSTSVPNCVQTAKSYTTCWRHPT